MIAPDLIRGNFIFMHMADALLSPAVGGLFWCASAAVIALSCRKLSAEDQPSRAPLMGMMGAFVFAAQMINFSIPATGSSGHLAGGLLLSILLGPYAAFVTMASILTLQALFFADGGLLALGCNIFNMGFWACFVAYPFIYRPILGANPSRRRALIAAIFAGVAALQLGALSVVLETYFSGVSALPLRPFLWAMQPIHLAIGLVEGMITAAVVSLLWQARPDVQLAQPVLSRKRRIATLGAVGCAALLLAMVVSNYASAKPDGLEYSIKRIAGAHELPTRPGKLHAAFTRAQKAIAFLPDYAFPASRDKADASQTKTSSGNAVAGLTGAALTLALVAMLGVALRKRRVPDVQG